jgi:UrcA family protein
MRSMMTVAIAGVLASALVASVAAVESLEPVTVTASRVVKVQASPLVNELSLSARVSYAGLDLATSAGAKELEARVNDAAQTVCKEIGRLYPDAWPTAAECAKSAAAKAMVRVHEVVAKAGGKAAK